MLTFHGRLITSHLFWDHVCLSEFYLFCLCVCELDDYPEYEFGILTSVILDMGSSSLQGLIIVQGQEENGDFFRDVFFLFYMYKIMVC